MGDRLQRMVVFDKRLFLMTSIRKTGVRIQEAELARRSPDVSQLPLNALRAFEASARHLSFTRAGLELRVSQAAVSQQVKILESNLCVQLFRRLTRGLALTEEGEALLPAVSDAFGRINHA